MICKICLSYYNKNESLKSHNIDLRSDIQNFLFKYKTETTALKQFKKNDKMLNRICPNCFKKIHKKIYKTIIDEVTA